MRISILFICPSLNLAQYGKFRIEDELKASDIYYK